MSIMGVTYSILASSLWPMVSIVIPDHQLGTAYGLMQSIQNLGLAVISIAAGAIVDAKGFSALRTEEPGYIAYFKGLVDFMLM